MGLVRYPRRTDSVQEELILLPSPAPFNSCWTRLVCRRTSTDRILFKSPVAAKKRRCRRLSSGPFKPSELSGVAQFVRGRRTSRCDLHQEGF